VLILRICLPTSQLANFPFSLLTCYANRLPACLPTTAGAVPGPGPGAGAGAGAGVGADVDVDADAGAGAGGVDAGAGARAKCIYRSICIVW
jgi:hypothetical protein